MKLKFLMKWSFQEYLFPETDEKDCDQMFDCL